MKTIRFQSTKNPKCKNKTWQEPQGRFTYQLIHRIDGNDYELIATDTTGRSVSLGELDSYATGATQLVKKHLASNK